MIKFDKNVKFSRQGYPPYGAGSVVRHGIFQGANYELGNTIKNNTIGKNNE
ncbi:hypothetical protein OFO07_02565 [Campylobacter sp. JMF_06 NA1]|uniref:hypothetical protein n=1 Tax=Campylobacter sp. JMF_06 NA1 TaxID=2983823 RepID=UPI0022E9E3AD|nr:hypothetical protein [Campylobacter sp. JMF_06 NA1]MDA3077809.1 hypothetical protein [Campylobacter sp. JMF_06 NA1]